MRVSGLAALVRVENGELANDQILIDPLTGLDRVNVRGSEAAETITIAPAAAPDHIRVTSSTASASIDLVSAERLLVKALGGDDTIAGSNGLATLTTLTADGGAGNDTIGGGDGADELLGGPENDAIDGNRGDDVAFLGAGDDTFTWDPGDGSDRIEGQAGSDALLFNGAGAAENIDVSANGQRVRFFRDVASITMDLDDTERIEFRALGGADNIVVNDLSGTDVTQVDNDLAGTLGGSAGDGLADRLTVNGTNGADSIEITGADGNVAVTGLAARVTAKNAEPANDTLDVRALGGDDTVSAAALAASAIKLTVDGGAGEDEILGGAGIDLLLGGAQADFVDGNRGDDVGFLGSEDDTFRWDPGDGSDVVEGQAGFDTLLFNGAGAAENIDVSANGGRVRFFRDVASITMDLDDTERIEFRALGGADNVVVNDLSGTDVTQVETDLAAAIGGAVGDGQPDTVTVNGTNGNDVIVVAGQNGTATLTGLPASVRILNAEPANDRLVVRALGGNDVVSAIGLLASAIAFTVDGGDANDVLVGGLGGDRLNGEAGDDVVDGGPGADQLSCGPGNDIVLSDAADTIAADCL
jgi:Ca2+-binding RTX toxin-like protein